jgi:hypothetical protein
MLRADVVNPSSDAAGWRFVLDATTDFRLVKGSGGRALKSAALVE